MILAKCAPAGRETREVANELNEAGLLITLMNAGWLGCSQCGLLLMSASRGVSDFTFYVYLLEMGCCKQTAKA